MLMTYKWLKFTAIVGKAPTNLTTRWYCHQHKSCQLFCHFCHRRPAPPFLPLCRFSLFVSKCQVAVLFMKTIPYSTLHSWQTLRIEVYSFVKIRNMKCWQSISTCFMATIRICKLSDFTKKSSPSRKCLKLLCDGKCLFWLWCWKWCYGLSKGTLGNRHGTAAPLAMFVVWIGKPIVFVWSSTPPTTI